MALGDTFDKKTIRGIDDTLIINDISLKVSPTQINITNRSLNYEWETLRTEGTHRAKSGHSTVNISMNIVFVGEEAINTTLRPLVAQLRLTPFCYVQNDHIRDSLFPGESGVTELARDSADQETIALAFRSCTLEVDPQTAPITVQGLFEFTYFNYKPYSPYFEFKRDMADIALPSGGVAGHTPFPWESAPWKAFYAPRLQRTKPLTEKFAARAEILFPEYRVTSTDTAQNLEAEIKILNELAGPTPERFLERFSDNIGANIALTVQQAGVLSGALTPEDTIGSAETLMGVLRDASPRFQQQRNDIQHSVTSDRTGYSNLIVQEQILAAISLVQNKIQGVQDLTESVDKFEKVPELSSDKVGGMGTFKRLRKLELLVEQGIVIVNIRVQIRNSLATLPIIGHRYATLQHMGSRDAIIDIDTMCTTEAANRRLAWFYTAVEEGILKNKKLPQGAQVIQVDNDFLRLFDLQYFITQDHSSDTIPGEPGTYAVTLRLVESAIKPTTKLESEELRPEYASNDSELHNRLVKIALEKVRFSQDQERFVVRYSELDKVRDQAFIKSIEELLHHFNTFLKVIRKALDDENNGSVFLNDTISGQKTSALFGTREEQMPGITLIQDQIAETQGLEHLEDMARFSNNLTFNRELIESDSLGNIRRRLAQRGRTREPEFNQAILEEREQANRNRYQLGDTTARAIAKELQALGGDRWGKGTVEGFISSLEAQNWFQGINSWATGILSSSRLVIQQYAPVYNEVTKTGFRKGRPAYPDFDLKIIADALGVPETSIDPDFYFFSPIRDTISGMVDPTMVDIAKTVALESYNSIKTEMSRYFKDGWLGKFSPDTADAFIKFAEDNVLEPEPGNPRPMEVDDGDTWENAGQHASKVSTQERPASPIVIEPERYSTDEKFFMNDRAKQTLLPAGTIHHSADPGRLFNGVTATTGSASTGSPSTATSPSGGNTPVDIAYTPSFAGGERMQAPLGHMEQMSPFGKERTKDTYGHTVPGGGARQHKGLDLKASEGTPVFAIADGTVRRAQRILNSDGSRNAAGVAIVLGHLDNSVSKYFHLKDGSLLVKAGDIVKRGKQIALSGVTSHKNIDKSENPHLHLEMWDTHNRPLNPANYFPVMGDTSRRQRVNSGAALGPGTGASAQISVLKASIEQFEKSLKNGQAFRMARAFPTFKLYFIEDDSEDRRRFGADDFFSYNSIRSIRVVRNRKIAADLMVIEVTNISGNLTSRKFSYEDPTKQQNTDTTKENPISKLVVQEGMDVELKLGYMNDPDKLTSVFVGKVMEVELNETEDLIILTCQSHAIEMVQSIKGLEKPKREHGWFLSTNEAATDVLLENLISSPEVVHFGRWERSKAVNFDTQTFRHVLQNKWRLKPTPQDDNIFINRARDARLDTGWLWSNLEFSIHQRTIWDIFQEMTLRHPGWIAQPVPYRDRFGPRMTMFFGLPGQLYFSRDPTLDELRMQEDIKQSVRQDATEALERALRDPSFRSKFINAPTGQVPEEFLGPEPGQEERQLDRIDTDPAEARKFAIRMQRFINRSRRETGQGGVSAYLHSLMVAAQRAMMVRREEELGREREIIRPFRKYHLLTSAHHIVYNNIRSSAKDSYNTVSILHGARKFNEKTEEFEATSDLGAFTLKADAGLPDEEIRELLVSDYVNCNNEGLARRYAQALLADQLRNIYRGELVIVGNPDIQPNDIAYVMDDYSDMIGPIEVDQVIHILSHETGFITEITPSMFVTTNEFANMTLSDAMGVYIEGATANMYSQIYGLDDPSHFLGGVGNTAGAGMMAAAGTRVVPVIAGGAGAGVGEVGRTIAAGARSVGEAARWGEGIGGTASNVARAGWGALRGGAIRAGAAVAGGATTIGAAPFILAAAAVGLWGWGLYSRRKILDFTNHTQPVFMHPLMHNGRPMLAGLPLRKLDNGWTTRRGQWSKDTAEGWNMLWEDFWDKVTFAPTQGDFSTIFSGSTVPPKF